MNRHHCTIDKCYKVQKGKLVNVCPNCTHGAMTSVLGYTPKDAKYQLRSAVAMARKHPRTFQIPDAGQRSSLPKGAHAKLMFRKGTSAERMWVRITSRTGTGSKTRYRGKLANSPVLVDLKMGSTVEFGPQHIIDITSAQGYERLSNAQKACVQLFMPEEMAAYKAGRFSSRKQAAAVTYSRARREC